MSVPQSRHAAEDTTVVFVVVSNSDCYVFEPMFSRVVSGDVVDTKGLAQHHGVVELIWYLSL